MEARLQVEEEDTQRQREDRERLHQAEERQRQLALKLGEIEARRHANNLKVCV